MQSVTVEDLERAVKDAEKTVRVTEKRIHDLKTHTVITLDEETLRKLQTSNRILDQTI